MTGKHHLIAGAVCGVCVGASAIIAPGNTSYLIACGAVGTTMIGSLLPDIDSRTSKLGSKMKITSFLANKLFGHRGFLHSPLFIVFVMWLLNFIFTKNGIQDYSLLWQGLAFGMINHLMCDMMTKGGIPILYPFFKLKLSFTNMKSGSKWELIPLILVCILTVVATYVLCKNGTFIV